MDSHLSICPQCREEMRDLYAFRETLTSSPLTEQISARAQGFQGLRRFLSSIGTSFGRSRLRFAGGLAALVLVALAVVLWIVWKSSATKPGAQEIVKTQPSPVVTETPAPPLPSPSVLQQSQPPQDNSNTANTTSPQPVQQRTAPPVNRAPVVAPPGVSKEILVALNDGGRKVTVDSRGEVLGLDNLSPSEQRAVRAALLTGRVPASSELAGLTGRTDGTLMGAPGSAPSFGLQSPVGVVSRTDTPTFRWNALAGATRYRVNVFDAGFNKVLSSGAVTKTEWTAPRALPRGAVYVWQVTAVVEGKEIQAPIPPAPEARFRILGRAQEEDLRRAEKSYAGSHLALGVLYSRAGLLDEAEREFRALLAANPDSQVAQKLLRNVEALKGGK